MRKILATLFSALAFSICIFGLTGCSEYYTETEETVNTDERSDKALAIANELVPEYYPDIDFSTYYFKPVNYGDTETDLVAACDRYEREKRILINVATNEIYVSYESQYIIDYADKLIRELYQLDDEHIKTYIYFEIPIPEFEYEGEMFVGKHENLLPLGRAGDEDYFNECLENRRFFIYYSIAVDESVDIEELYEKTDINLLGNRMSVSIDQYTDEEFRENSMAKLRVIDPIKTIVIERNMDRLRGS